MERQKLSVKKTVKQKDCALTVKSGDLEVLSTPTVLSWMEEVSADLARQFLNDNETTVGVHVELDHLAPAFVGDTVEVKTVLEEKGKKKLVFNVEAKKNDKILAKAKHVRVIVNKGMFSR